MIRFENTIQTTWDQEKTVYESRQQKFRLTQVKLKRTSHELAHSHFFRLSLSAS